MALSARDSLFGRLARARIREAGPGGWITIHSKEGEEEGGGTHIFIGSGGRITKGPSSLMGVPLSALHGHGGGMTAHPIGHEPKGAKDHPTYTESSHAAKGGTSGGSGRKGNAFHGKAANMGAEHVASRLKAAQQSAGRRRAILAGTAPVAGAPLEQHTAHHAAAATEHARLVDTAVKGGDRETIMAALGKVKAHRETLKGNRQKEAFDAAFKTAHTQLKGTDHSAERLGHAQEQAHEAARASLLGEGQAPLTQDEAADLAHRATTAAYGAEFNARTGLNYQEVGPYQTHEENDAELTGKRHAFYSAAHQGAKDAVTGADLYSGNGHNAAMNAAQAAGYATGHAEEGAGFAPLPGSPRVVRSKIERQIAQEALEHARNINSAAHEVKMHPDVQPMTKEERDYWSEGWGEGDVPHDIHAELQKHLDTHNVASNLRTGLHKAAYDAAFAAVGSYRPSASSTTAKIQKRHDAHFTSENSKAIRAAQDAAHAILFSEEGKAAFPRATKPKAAKEPKAPKAAKAATGAVAAPEPPVVTTPETMGDVTISVPPISGDAVSRKARRDAMSAEIASQKTAPPADMDSLAAHHGKLIAHAALSGVKGVDIEALGKAQSHRTSFGTEPERKAWDKALRGAVVAALRGV